MVQDATTHSKAEFQREERVNKSGHMRQRYDKGAGKGEKGKKGKKGRGGGAKGADPSGAH